MQSEEIETDQIPPAVITSGRQLVLSDPSKSSDSAKFGPDLNLVEEHQLNAWCV
jgi:hypothetical protein